MLQNAYSNDVYAITTWLFISHPVVLPVVTCLWRKLDRSVDWSTCCTGRQSPSVGSDDVTTCAACRRHYHLQKTAASPKHRQRVGITLNGGGGGGLGPSYDDDGGGGGNGLQYQGSLSRRRYPVATIPVLFATEEGLHVHRSTTTTTPASAASPAFGRRPPPASVSVRVQHHHGGRRRGDKDGERETAVDDDDGDDDGGSRGRIAMIAVQCDVFGSFYNRSRKDVDSDDDEDDDGEEDDSGSSIILF